MLFCIQANPCLPNNTQLQLPRLESSWRTLTPLKVLRPAAKTSTYLSFALVPKLRHHNLTAKYPRKSLVCLLGGKDKPEGENEGSPLKSLGNAFGSFQGKSVEDVLKEQMQKQEFYDGGGGGGGSPPRGGGGGGGASGGSQDDDLPGVLDETLQVVLATVGFILLVRQKIPSFPLLKFLSSASDRNISINDFYTAVHLYHQWRGHDSDTEGLPKVCLHREQECSSGKSVGAVGKLPPEAGREEAGGQVLVRKRDHQHHDLVRQPRQVSTHLSSLRSGCK
ncbi:unnamed protein product [Linum tenue]|uniref:Uncharacterized protein n=1 Tax=Linum tenue TaxID=586396 RepID=A0AAV0IH03_9ROSI|nr:unnamed protein product [Linum tenue]